MADNRKLRIVMRANSIFGHKNCQEILCYPKGDGVTAEDFLRYIDHWRMRICSRCYDVCGYWKYKPEIIQLFSEEDLLGESDLYGIETLRYQKCSCKDKNSAVSEQKDEDWKWLGFDYREIIELCYCCGQELLTSGSRWSVFFCEDCKRKVIELNKKFQGAVIPIGRHSMMNGIGLNKDVYKDPKLVEQFVTKADKMFASIKKLEQWTAQRLSENFKVLGYYNDVFLNDYLTKVAVTIDNSEAFGEMRDFLFSTPTGQTEEKKSDNRKPEDGPKER